MGFDLILFVKVNRRATHASQAMSVYVEVECDLPNCHSQL